MSRLLTAAVVWNFAALTAAAGVALPVPRLPAAALKPNEPQVEILSPEQLAGRVQQNTKAAADRLADSDSGAETRREQAQALKDLDALLKQAQNPPMGGQNNQQNDQSNQDQKPNQGNSPPMGKSPPMGGGMKQPRGGSGQQPKQQGWRDRRGQGSKPQGAQQQPKDQGPMTQDAPPTPAPSGPPAGATPGGGTKGTAALPLDETITKHVWGHLPERLRQQMSQYYKEQFMPKYSDMLRQYYASLAEREKAQKKP